MPHGKPDWGVDWAPRTVRGLEDLGEHAVRLGSPHLWDRRGDVILTDTFEHGLGQADQALSGLLAAIALMGGHSWWGANCASLTPGSNLLRYAWLVYRHGLPVNSRTGLEFTFTLAAETDFWYWHLSWRDGTVERFGEVRYDHQNDILEVQERIGGWTQFAADLNLAVGARIWHTGKLVVDFALYDYVRFILNGTEWDLTGRDIGQTALGLARELFVYVGHYGTTGNNPVGYTDNVIVTQNEP